MANRSGDNKARGNRALIIPDSDVAMLVTSATEGVRDCGSGFCVSADEQASSVVTCAHVISDLDTNRSDLKVKVNGFKATAVTSADDQGIDLALLNVPKLRATALNISKQPVKQGSKFVGVGYVHLHGGHYVSRAVYGSVSQLLTMRAQLSENSTPSLLLTADEGTSFEPGNSGTAICNANGDVIGILAFASRDGKQGYALASSALAAVVPVQFGIPSAGSDQGDARDITTRPLPPELGPVKFDDDPQKGRFGGANNDGHVELTARLRRVSSKYFYVFDITVKPIKPGLELYPPARFYLHDSFPRSVIQITRPDGNKAFTLSEVHSYGAFVVGCLVFASDGNWHSTEYDLVNLPDLPESFRNR